MAEVRNQSRTRPTGSGGPAHGAGHGEAAGGCGGAADGDPGVAALAVSECRLLQGPGGRRVERFRRHGRSSRVASGRQRTGRGRAGGIGGPGGPGAGEERRLEPGDRERGDLVGGGDAGPAVHADARRVPAPRSSNRLRSTSGGRNVPSAARFSPVGAETAPGMCPARGSTGSTSPRYRSPARASNSSPDHGEFGCAVGIGDRQSARLQHDVTRRGSGRRSRTPAAAPPPARPPTPRPAASRQSAPA